ncbi:flavodoxin family protein [Psychrosphaera algicola]|uniref:NAD(P)H-dependent oxidoreductase n=1 Tax=Psychrosphaera algicola TaxID=3023714 RepID=A0ABT5FCL9_9GAMM|nr:NAD(P)H-dependent oxidoreductase [Psychrosphaera sp. G1-22]MDC2889285.1 NAD(P)H-dependent oxidoreductase [Psychrosphaera sp. G1-22]
MSESTVIILGSSRSDGNTSALVHDYATIINATVVDLNDYEISPFDYNADYNDDFISLMAGLLKYDRIILATPMYWYSASAQMKTFIDRWSDLLKTEKAKGRQLRGKQVVVLATGSDKIPPNCFEQMFQLTFRYLGMDYRGMLYCQCESQYLVEHHHEAIAKFVIQMDRN